MPHTSYPKWITDSAGVRRIVQNHHEHSVSIGKDVDEHGNVSEPNWLENVVTTVVDKIQGKEPEEDPKPMSTEDLAGVMAKRVDDAIVQDVQRHADQYESSAQPQPIQPPVHFKNRREKRAAEQANQTPVEEAQN